VRRGKPRCGLDHKIFVDMSTWVACDVWFHE
jgi:hypothetical protein